MPFTSSSGDAKNIVYRLTAFQSESVMHRLKCQNGRGFDTEMFLMNFWSGGGKVPLQQKKLCSIKIN